MFLHYVLCPTRAERDREHGTVARDKAPDDLRPATKANGRSINRALLLSIWVTIPLIFLYVQTPHSPKKPQRRRYSSAACTNPGNEGSTTAPGVLSITSCRILRGRVQLRSTERLPEKSPGQTMVDAVSQCRGTTEPTTASHQAFDTFFQLISSHLRTLSTSTGNTRTATLFDFPTSPNGAELNT